VARPAKFTVSVRDHVPGNWCVLEDGSGGVTSERWRPNDGPLALDVYLPDENGPRGSGVCLAGGAGGEFFPVGNPDSFYLYVGVDAKVTATPTQ
jgi:hypothetical protein